MSNEKQRPGYRIGYARVSTLEQDHVLQHDALTRACCQRIFTDKASGKLEHRPALDAMRAQLRPGDIAVVWRQARVRSRTGGRTTAWTSEKLKWPERCTPVVSPTSPRSPAWSASVGPRSIGLSAHRSGRTPDPD